MEWFFLSAPLPSIVPDANISMSKSIKLLGLHYYRSLTLTLLSQLPAIKKFCANDEGLNANEDTESSGGDMTSKSFIGFVEVDVDCAPKALPPPNGF